jgi:hypothetical protein
VLPVQKVSIRRVKPDSVIEYLQDDLTWSTTASHFAGDIIKGRLPEDSWEDFRFYNTFDQVGQWDFYCDVTLLGFAAATYTSVTSVYCEKLQSIKDFALDHTGNGIFFDKEDYLCVSSTNSYYRYKLNSDIYIADFENQRLIFREGYDSIEVNYE